ncbi:transposase [Streptomyces sp. GXMU-J5]|uniref:Transposase n=1 Tax=Streptomyces beihaiensis TaxID=2984495 RepID=A0ABT3TNQ6_9ACTN|nr:transposase [Streptomyces beihaiensis]MCX3058688.1 transposase [Streptomyces beihaiensis]
MSATAPLSFPAYCQDLFRELTRCDQRRWGEVYVRGLLDVPGRKTPTRISEHVLGRPAVQQLQQFVHQSPWECGPVRRQTARWLTACFDIDAWSVDEAVFVKNGDRSVGVARQFAPSQERTVNCQLACAVSLVGSGGGLPVNWRLLLPPRWDHDEQRREGAHVPEHEHSRPRWQYVLEALDEMTEEWLLDPRPVLADWRHESETDPLLLGLEARGLGYLVEVSPRTPVTMPRPHSALPVVRGTVADLAAHVARRTERTPVGWHDRLTERRYRSQFLSTPALLCPDGSGGPVAAAHRPTPRHLVVDWPFGRPEPRAYWLTNLPARRLAEAFPLSRLRSLADEAMRRLHDDFGLGDFEGRSFRGWHHHVTLASAALGFDALRAAVPSEPKVLAGAGVAV